LNAWKNDWYEALVSLLNAADAIGIHSTIILDRWPDVFDDISDERKWGWDEEVKWEDCEHNQVRGRK
jgi:hypothetical protein